MIGHFNSLQCMEIKRLARWSGLCCVLSMTVACSRPSSVEQSLKLAGDNRSELEAVLDTYRTRPEDSLKLRAAEYLIANMKYHGSTVSPVLDQYRKRFMQSDTVVEYHTFNQWWKELSASWGDSVQVTPDVKTVNAAFLVRHIEHAFRAWENAPWHDEVSFNLFCRYILPYRFSTEMLDDATQEYLYEHYQPLVAGEKDVRKVFAILHDTVWKRSADLSECIYILDPVALDKQGQLQCYQCCVLLGNIYRVLGIPVAMDAVNSWANYSLQGHAWLSLVLNDGTYTMARNDSIARKGLGVDGAEIVRLYKPEKDFPFKYAFTKRPSKVWRTEFGFNKEIDYTDSTLKQLFSPMQFDVSTDYCLGDSLVMKSEYPVKNLFVGNFRSGDDWRPIGYACLTDGECVFRGLGDSIMYVPMAYYKDKWRVLENPFILSDGNKKVFNPDLEHRITVRLNRKYPFIAHWTNQWAAMLGTYFEGSNDPDFHTSTRLHTIDHTPVFPNHVKLEGFPKFRYVRYVCDLENTRMNDLAFFCHGKELKGHVIGCDPTDTLTMNKPYVYTYKKGSYDRIYTRGIDFGSPVNISEIFYLPKNDGNFVTKGHDYELFYYDLDWKSLGRQIAPDYEPLTFENVPTHAVLLLKDHTKGHEERIFTYEHGEQVWW